MRLLIVEDDDRSGGYLVRGLSESGHVADRATDGETGLALALEEIYDVLIVDRRLPGLDGISLVRAPAKAGNCHPGSDAERHCERRRPGRRTARRLRRLSGQAVCLRGGAGPGGRTRSPRMTGHAVSPCCALPI